jgi:hypothetical protein
LKFGLEFQQFCCTLRLGFGILLPGRANNDRALKSKSIACFPKYFSEALVQQDWTRLEPRLCLRSEIRHQKSRDTGISSSFDDIDS